MSIWEASEPYNALPPLPPNQDIESKTILRQCIEARAALAELKRAADLIPNQSMLTNTLPLMEAQASSEIENIVTTTDHLFRQIQLDGHEPDPATKEALQYRTALFAGFQALRDRPLCTQTAELVCSEIKGREMPVRQTIGTALRSGAHIIYTPPVGEALIRDKLANWEQFIHGEALDPLIVMAVAHYQFEAIHPFADGNGRTGRILNSLLLIEKGLLSLPILYLSRYIIAHKADYYRLLLEVTRDGHWEAWIGYILRGVEDTARWTTAKIDAIRQLHEHTRDYVQAKLPAMYSRELLDLVFSEPYTRIGNVAQAGIAKRQTAAKYLKSLAEIGVLQEISVGRDKLFTHPALLQLLREDGHSFAHYVS